MCRKLQPNSSTNHSWGFIPHSTTASVRDHQALIRCNNALNSNPYHSDTIREETSVLYSANHGVLSRFTVSNRGIQSCLFSPHAKTVFRWVISSQSLNKSSYILWFTAGSQLGRSLHPNSCGASRYSGRGTKTNVAAGCLRWLRVCQWSISNFQW